MKLRNVARSIGHTCRFSSHTIHRPAVKYDAALLQGYNSCHTVVDVQWGSQDAFQHVNNVIYSRWCEQARINTFNAFIQYAHKHSSSSGGGGSSAAQQFKQFMSTQAIGPILKQITLKYRSPVVYPDTVVVGSRIHNLQPDRLSMLHRIVSVQQNAIVCDSDDTIVTYDYRQRCKADMPREIYTALQQFMQEMNAEPVIPYRPKHAA